MDKNVLNETKLFEKIEIQWFTVKQMRQRMSEFREFYQQIVAKILADLPKITRFISSKAIKAVRSNKRTRTNNKTRKYKKRV